MQAELIEKQAFCVIGKEGDTSMGEGFVQRLWQEANSHFDQVAALAKKLPDGGFAGCWGAMSRRKMDFLPWEDNFTQGKYLAGIECNDEAQAPDGWSKWQIPGFAYIRILCEDGNTFAQGLEYLAKQGYDLAGAVQDYTDLNTQKSYMCFPIRRL